MEFWAVFGIVLGILGFISLSLMFHEEAKYILGRIGIGTFQENREREKEILDYTNRDYTKRTRGVTTTRLPGADLGFTISQTTRSNL
jgi:hypothetical protein